MPEVRTKGYTVEKVPAEEIERQRVSYSRLLEELGSASHQEIREALEAREPGEPEAGLDPELVKWLKQRLAAKDDTEAAAA